MYAKPPPGSDHSEHPKTQEVLARPNTQESFVMDGGKQCQDSKVKVI